MSSETRELAMTTYDSSRPFYRTHRPGGTETFGLLVAGETPKKKKKDQEGNALKILADMSNSTSYKKTCRHPAT